MVSPKLYFISLEAYSHPKYIINCATLSKIVFQLSLPVFLCSNPTGLSMAQTHGAPLSVHTLCLLPEVLLISTPYTHPTTPVHPSSFMSQPKHRPSSEKPSFLLHTSPPIPTSVLFSFNTLCFCFFSFTTLEKKNKFMYLFGPFLTL